MHVVQLEESSGGQSNEGQKDLNKFCRNWQRVREMVCALIIGALIKQFKGRQKWVDLEPQWDEERIIILGFWVVEQEIIDMILPGEMAPYLYAEVSGVDASIIELAKDLDLRPRELLKTEAITATSTPPSVSIEMLAIRLAKAEAVGQTILTFGQSADHSDVNIALIKGELMDLYFSSHGGAEGFHYVELPAFPPELVLSIQAELKGELISSLMLSTSNALSK